MGAFFFARAAAATGDEAAGQDDLEPLAADLDDDALALAGLLRASATAPAYGSIGLSNSVSIQRVCTVNGSSPAGANAGSATTTRWNGSTVGMPSTTNSASARRERSSAWCAGRAGDDELGQHRVERAADDVARDDAGVEADARARRRLEHARRRPGAGRKPRPASSPLIRNSNEWPSGAGSS